jgi:hypothetical protein
MWSIAKLEALLDSCHRVAAYNIGLDTKEEDLFSRDIQQRWSYDDILWICFEELATLGSSGQGRDLLHTPDPGPDKVRVPGPVS